MGNELHSYRAGCESLSEFLSGPSPIKRLRVLDDSMAGTICAGDIITVDMSDTVVTSGHCYLIFLQGAVQVRRVLESGAAIRFISDSQDKGRYLDQVAACDSPDFIILGRVTDRRGDNGL